MLIDKSLLPARKNHKEKGGGTKKYGRNRAKCKRYRLLVGRPAGPGMDGQHSH